MEKIVTIGGVDVTMKANAATPRYYLEKYGRDVFVDMAKLKAGDTNNNSLRFMEGLAWLMAWQADQTIPPIMEWLEQFDSPSAILNAGKEIMLVWGENNQTMAEPKKKEEEPSDP